MANKRHVDRQEAETGEPKTRHLSSQEEATLEALLMETQAEGRKPCNYHIKATGSKGCFQWLVTYLGEIIDSPYHLRGFWIGRLVDVPSLRQQPKEDAQILVRCSLTGQLTTIKVEHLEVIECDENIKSIPDYDYSEPYTGGLYDLTTR